MAAPNGTMSDSESSSSSSNAEELARCHKAAILAWGLEQPLHRAVKPRAGAANNQLSTSQPSLRPKVDEHEQDGNKLQSNKLQSTPQFRAHVAKKLGALLDSSITISEVAKEPKKAQVQKVASEVDGFRLFFTSVPGGREKEESPQPRRKRRPSSSSSEDSDEEWQRCREAAVSASDILQESAIHGPGTVVKEAKKKRKSKKKAKKVAIVATTTPSVATVQKQKSGELTRDQVSLGTKKKKKAKKASEASPLPPAKNATAVPAN
uniref:Protein CUSTOS n=1 Tax=Callithrix jacchus TaxID=9483 RepID=A0A8I3W2E7_CALJA|nr:protein CUSTOS-like [Callithrix jacchus]